MRTNKFRLVIFLVIVLLIYPLTLLRAESHIKNITLQREGDYTNVTILAESPFQFNHFIEEKEDGKPYRIVIDCLNSVHALQQNNFMKLPSGTISAIRTSQYQNSPEKICRVVIDLKDPVIYKVVEKQDKKTATLALSTPQDPLYPEWSAVQAEAGQGGNVSTSEKSNKSIALKDETNKLSEKELASTVTPEKKISPSKETKTAVAQKVALKEKAQSPVKKEKQANPPAAVKEAGEKQAPPAEKDTQIKLVQTEKTPPEKTAPPQVKKEEQKSKAAEQTEVKKPEKPAGAKTESQVEKPEARVAGKKIEEVPQRKLLVYHSGEREDPFSPLTGKKSFTLGTAPLPNIEELKLVGILESNNGFKALLENELGFGYILQTGDKIRNGAVVSIDKERIIFQIWEYGFTKNIALELFTPNQEER